MEHVGEFPELVLRADCILEMRSNEMEILALTKKDDVINLRPLHLTAYGYQVLEVLKMNVTCPVMEYGGASRILKEIGFGIKVKEGSEQEGLSPHPNMSASLVEYIIQLVKSRTEKEIQSP
ncbi:MAG: hypothetical protein ACTSV2_03605 [Candidatus Thorarchaeota archaeon]